MPSVQISLRSDLGPCVPEVTTSPLSLIHVHCLVQAWKTHVDMGFQSGGGVSNGKKKRSRKLQTEREQAETLPGDLPDLPAEEPPLAAPARKRSRSAEPCRKSRRGEPEPWKPTPRGPPAAKSKRTPIAELPPEQAEALRSANRQYAKTAWQKKQAAVAANLPEAAADASGWGLTKTGKQRKSKKAERDAKYRAVSAIADAVERVGGDTRKQGIALRDALESKRLKEQAAYAGYTPAERRAVAVYHQEQLTRMLERATQAVKKRGRATDDKRSFVESNLVAIAPSPKRPGQPTPPSLNARARALSEDGGLSFRTAQRLLSAAESKRGKLTERAEGVSWSQVKARRGHRKVTEEIRMALHEWIFAHPRVVNSPIANDTLLVLNPQTGKKERTGKLLLEISVRELHNDLISTEQGGLVNGLGEARDDKGKVIISDTALRYLLPPQLKPMTERHKIMCGCETCIVPDQLQQTLNAFRVRLKKQMLAKVAAMPKGSQEQREVEDVAVKYQPTLNLDPPAPWHGRPRMALACVQCAPKPDAPGGFPHWNCVLAPWALLKMP